ncbi:chemotaxis protein CheA [Phycobacter sp. K97]|uniref:chemotaxis protein CheA n=1 Tax=Phycobacter sedimenti TaxID=3133977 RepID=UPI00311FAE6A
MVQNNKVLTVSYGTFSCTLEGFEDSFGTMKAIAEYFRDLASDDRYFGAEPPQPDADMLARIAQREIARQVEARTSDAGIHLRAAETPAPALTPAPSRKSAPADLSGQEVSTSQHQTAAAPKAASDDAPTEATAGQDAGTVNETDHDQLAAPETGQSAETALPPEAPEASAAMCDAPEPDADKIAAISAAVAANAAQSAAQTQSEPEEDEEGASLSAEGAFDDDQVAAVNRSEDRSAASAESISAKLRRIRAVVSKTSEEDYSEDEHAEDILPEASADMSDVLGTAAPDDNSLDAVGEAPSTEDVSDEESDEISRVLSQLGSENGETDQNAPAASADEDQDQDEDLNTGSEDSAALETAEADPAEASPAAPAPRRPRARVIKVKRAELEEAVSDGALKPAPAAPRPAVAEEDTKPSPGIESSLSDEDEEDLMRELAAVEAELLAASEDDAQDEKADEDVPAAAQDQESEPKASTRQAPNVAESDVSRLMEAADAKLGAPETTSSRETYNHLRAAVAAAKADPVSGGTAGTADSEGAYREDLANVVKPRRLAAGGVQPLRKSRPGPRPAPLKLVAEQRIDPDQEPSATTEKQAIRPRRISVLDDGGDAKSNAEGGFAAYAQDCGAVDLPDLLEAAAAYMSFVEGRDHFSRPQLLNAVRQSGTADFKREDGLRSFGQLLREGKIERSENGRFVATEDIGFQPAKRAAG